MKAILVDVTRCAGCNQCVRACCQAHTMDYTPQDSFSVDPDGLSAQRFVSILKTTQAGTNTARYVRKSCQHCLDPACVSVCPVGAMYRSEIGAVRYDPSVCMGCRYCMMACPYGVPRYEWESVAPRVRKCDLCYDRIVEGQMPACVEACPNKVLTFGDRDALLSQAHRQISAEPGRYRDTVFGEHEVGGTGLLYISDIPLDMLGMHGNPGTEARPKLSAAWLDEVPGVSLASLGLMTGLFYFIGRRMSAEQQHLQNEEQD
jgi:formate dehydrogenase iron-sulfur subunit